MLHEEITQDIIGASMVVLNTLKPGLDEKLYENALVLELQARGHAIDQQREFSVHYRGQLIGTLIPDQGRGVEVKRRNKSLSRTGEQFGLCSPWGQAGRVGQSNGD